MEELAETSGKMTSSMIDSRNSWSGRVPRTRRRCSTSAGSIEMHRVEVAHGGDLATGTVPARGYMASVATWGSTRRSSKDVAQLEIMR